MSINILPKISLPKLSSQDIAVVSNACSKYSQDLDNLRNKENRAQQHIHYGILQVFRFELLKKMTNRNQAKENKLNMEVFTAFVVYDALQHFSNYCDNHLEQAIMRRIIMELFPQLPTTSDKHLSVMSELNFEN